MKKKITLLLLGVVCVLCCAVGLAACGGDDVTDAAKYITYRLQDDDTYAVSFSDDTGKMFNDYVVNGEKPMHCVIPAEHNGKPVTAIDDNMFNGKNYITEITIPDTIKTIGKQAFCRCGITSINLPDNVTSIGWLAFSGCNGLTSITVPGSVEKMDESVFSQCANLKSVTLGNGITRIEKDTFEGCEKLETVNIPQSVTYIGEQIFGHEQLYSCGIKKLELPDNITEIGFGALSACKQLESLTLTFPADKIVKNPEHPEETGTQSFDIYHIFGGDAPQSLKKITVTGGEVVGRFNYCHGLDEVVLKEGVTSIRGGAFQGSTIKSIVIPDSVTEIGYNAFTNCQNLESISIGKGLKKVATGNQFNGCEKLTTAEIAGFGELTTNNTSEPENIALNKWLGLDKETSTIRTIKIADGVTEIPEAAFRDCKYITKAIVPDSVTVIGKDAFRQCNALAEVTLGSGLKTIGDEAFGYCRLITELVLPEGLTTIEAVAFLSCEGLTKINIPESVTEVGKAAFANCKALELNEYDNGLYLGNEKNKYKLFYGAKNEQITSCEINENINFMCGTFGDCTLLESVSIPYGITYIPDFAFQGCTSLKEIVIPDSVTEIGEKAFENCSALTTVKLSENIKEIKQETFKLCTSLETITLPDSVQIIGPAAFQSCKKLASVTFFNKVTSIGNMAFYQCGSLAVINFKGTSLQWEAIEKGSDWNGKVGSYNVVYVTSKN